MRNFGILLLAICFSITASASSFTGQATAYLTYHFGLTFEGKPVRSVIAVPEAIYNDGSAVSGEPVRLVMRGKPSENPDHFFGKAKATFTFSHSASGEFSAPKSLRVRYLIYTKDASPETPVYSHDAGESISLYAKTDEEKDKIRKALDVEFAQVNDASETKSLFYSNEHYRNFFHE